MASGKPIVASDIQGYATVINQEIDGLLTAPRQSEELAWAICRLLEHESLRQRFIHAGLLKAREYAWPQVAQRVMDFYQELLDERGNSTMRQISRA